IVHTHHILAIADEVLTGFGRTGTFFASDAMDNSPDMMTLSKGITGGFLPLGVTLCTKNIYDTFLSSDRAKTFFHGHSYTGNPISCAAGVASLEIFESEPVFERIQTITNVHQERMPLLAKKNDNVFRILGTMAAMQPRKPEGYLSSRMQGIGRRCLESGLLLRPLGDTIYFLPPYSTTANDLHKAYDILEEVLQK
ncbi:MAG TPA: aminotransferase class III-fold pyridoxal phosphate-dependent enzyme, partial [Steroidobacteraceae bacterium]|nr:aminotransferase class III-fold pyridoxal phosphate-dependent enzyme [Steroidobacteraceae bacterium]